MERTSQRWASMCGRISLVAALLAMLSACGTNTSGLGRSAASVNVTSTLAFRSAKLEAPPAPSASTTLSCQASAFCRENVIARGHQDAIEEATEDCTRRGGSTRPSACARDAILASCSLAGEAGSIVVFTYAQDSETKQSEAVSTMSELCEQFEGSLEIASKN